MSDSESSKKKKPGKSNLNEDKQNKNSEKERPKKIIKSIREKEYINNEKIEINSYDEKKNEQSKDSFDIFIKKERFKVNKYSKLQKILEKNYVLNDYKKSKNFKKFEYNTEKKEISKSAETPTNKNKYNRKRENFYYYEKDEKNRKEKNNMNDHLVEYRTQEKENKNNYNRKNNKLNKNKIFENKPNDISEDIKNNKKLKNNFFYENKNILANIKIKGNEKKYKIKLNIIYIIYFHYIILNAIFFSQFIKCSNRKIELSSSFINLKVIGNGGMNLYSFLCSERPNLVSINNIIYLTNSEDNNYYEFNNLPNVINNITLTWNRPVSTTSNLFSYCTTIIEIDLSHFDTSHVNNMYQMFFRCIKLISLKLSNLNTSSVTTMRSMFDGCSSLISLDLSHFDTSQVNNMYQMFLGCSNLISLNLSNLNLLSVTSMEYMFDCCDNLEHVNLINAKINPDLISSSTSIFSKPPSNLFICSENEDWAKIFNLSDKQYVNCLNNIFYFNINEDEPIIKCYKKNIESDNPCQMCGNNYFNNSGIINNKYMNCFIEDIQDIINNLINQLNIFQIDNGEDEINIIQNSSIIISSTKNQKKNENENIITIDLCKCENMLKNEYNISLDDYLYILLIILEKEEGMKIPKIEYEIYYPFYENNTLTKLDLNICKGQKIEISIPVTINDILDKYNPKSGYYNDICYKTTSDSGTDISLKDRRNEFVENNMTLCEEKCDLINYNYTNEKVKCSCEIKTNISPNIDYKFNKNEFFKSFTDIKNIANINVIKCYKIVLNFKNLIRNYGFYIIASIMLLYIITIFIFISISYKKVKNNLFNISKILNKIEPIKNHPIIKGNKKFIEKKIKNNKKGKNIKLKNRDNSANRINIHKINSNKSFENNLKQMKKKINGIKDCEYNSLEYEEAFKSDKRNYFQYYISLLKYNHPFIYSFCTSSDYNSRIIKIFLFFFSFSSDLTINALFFNDDTMHKLYKDRGKFDLLF